MRLALKISSLLLIVIMAASSVLPTTAADLMEVLGHTFGETSWAVEVDANKGRTDGINLVRDLVDDQGNPASRVDLNDDFDNYFLMGWVNELGLQAAFIAHEMINNSENGHVGVLPSHVLLEHFTGTGKPWMIEKVGFMNILTGERLTLQQMTRRTKGT
ncbi:MAG: hypothetical protein ACFFBD_22635 [Candidatus Hodarchaeota archaeon]